VSDGPGPGLGPGGSDFIILEKVLVSLIYEGMVVGLG